MSSLAKLLTARISLATMRDMITEIPLKRFCETHTQAQAAQILGRTQGAVSQMIRAGREVFIVDHGDGRFTSYEKRPIEPRASTA